MILKLMRPSQWTKNAFLLAPLIFSMHLFELPYLVTALRALAVFCLFSSVVYVVNDIADREADRLHPIKRMRPLAASTLSVAMALFVLCVAAAAGIAIGMSLSWKFWFAAGSYVALNLAYSFGLKQLILVDVFVIATGFMLRVLAGAFAIAVVVSPWLILCTLFVSVFLAVSKRRAEILLQSVSADFSARPVLREYDISLIDQMMTIASSGMAISYALYTVAERTVNIFGTENLIFTTVFVIFGIFRYLYLVKRHNTDDNPTHLLLTDMPMLINVMAWLVSCVLIIYFNDLKSWML
ncbi:MAG: decaprenyl-phosphate phosphoribosyltransferase [Ignavibacteriales bacterium]|nr:decaprenyl-phosphate phosphoribosyltransferase [Ignavibacteriales bacterium]